jgi:hypothetical protein
VTTPPACICNDAWKTRGRELRLHADVQDTSSDAWKRLLELVEETGARKLEEFAPGQQLAPDDRHSIVTLPASIGKLTAVKRLVLYGSSLVRIPPEIGGMSSLEEFDPYTSYRLHWFPYEIIRCPKLARSRVSTRALYGNYKHRSPFPYLRDETASDVLDRSRPIACSVCRKTFDFDRVHARWLSLRVATDVLPLLAYACSVACVEALPKPPEGYVSGPHLGGRSLVQPPPRD